MATTFAQLDIVNRVLLRLGGLKTTQTQLDNEEGKISTPGLILDFLTRNNKILQQRGWHFNTEVKKLSPDANGEIPVPTSVAGQPSGNPSILNIDTVGSSRGVDVIDKNDKLFDLKNNTFTFSSEIEVMVVYLADLGQLPQEVVNYLVVKTAMDYNRSYKQAGALDQALAMEMVDRDRELKRMELDRADFNVLDSDEANAVRGRTRHTSRR